ncbi:MAG: hypothetical protein VB046_09625 [Paludibacter sp.]|nr:hypothetical protein [Paludibacter sp.]
MPYARVTVKKAGDNAGRTKGKASYLIVFDWRDVETYTRDDKGVKVNAFAFKTGKTPIGIYATPTTQNVYHQAAGASDGRSFIHHCDFEHPGDALEFNEFMENNSNVPLGVIQVPCGSSTDCRIAGLPCNPLEITQDNGQANNEATKHAIQMTQMFGGPVLGHIEKSLVPATDNADVNAELGIPGSGSDGAGV